MGLSALIAGRMLQGTALRSFQFRDKRRYSRVVLRKAFTWKLALLTQAPKHQLRN